MPLDNEESTNESLWSRVSSLVTGKNDTSARDALEEYVETSEENGTDSASAQERAILSNILKLRDVKVVDVMIPRADIIAIDVNTPQKELLSLFAEKQCSRVPVYKETMDNVLGTVHVKDILAALSDKKKIKVKDLLREIPVVSPTMDVFDLILDMRQKRRHMALVVDEYGGVDGVITISDVIEAIVGDLSDEHDTDEDPEVIAQEDGSLLADARVEIEDFEEEFGTLFTDDEREESDTLGGLVCDLAGRVPARGEILTHSTGMVFEVLDADPRRISLLKIHKVPK